MDFRKVAGANEIATFRKWVLPLRRALGDRLGTSASYLDFGNRILSVSGNYIFADLGNADRSSLPPMALRKWGRKNRFGAKTMEKCASATTRVFEPLAP